MTDVFVAVVFWIAVLISLGGAIGMLRSREMVRSALALVFGFSGVAVVYLILSADFLAVAQIIIYVGAIMILMLFAIMLTPGQVEIPGLANQGQTLAAGLVSAAVFVITTSVMLTTPWRIRTDFTDAPTTQRIGELLLSNYVLPFEIASVLLTAALIGALVIAREN
ncbi:MAG: NADH-quinone oxidoreductase subunit J [Chloroflexota bacterium]